MGETIARVMVDIAHSHVDKTFDYRIPAQLTESVVPGMRVFVPFGKGDKKTEAFVLEVACDTLIPPERLKDVLGRIDVYPALWPDQLALAHIMAERYGCLLVEALRLMLPAPLRGRAVEGKERVTLAVADASAALSFAKELEKRAPVQARVLNLLAEAGRLSPADLNRIVKGGAAAARALEKKGMVTRERIRVARRPSAALQEVDRPRPELNAEQAAAVQKIGAALPKGGEFLLYGVTGSGKTEVYMRVIETCRKQGRGALVLVPEISLTPQIMAQFVARFGEDVALIHSRLSEGERMDEWERVVTGRARVAVGARSAVFAPLQNIGVIVIDEEQENSYHSQLHPRYHAVEVARERAAAHGAVLVLCSATPSVETHYRALTGGAQMVRLHKRVEGRPMPQAEIVDMRDELRRGNRSAFSRTLYRRMKETLKRGEQVMLFVNRRGYSTQIVCLNCGQALKCGQCDVTLTYHSDPPRAICHYCHAQYPVEGVCDHCGAAYFRYQGVGTQKVEKQVRELFPEVTVLRMDLNTMQKKDAYLKAQQTFERGEAQVLIGTQMIAKGLDFKNVTLAGVISADATLLLPDFRSAERTFQLITQVAGRTGRGDIPGHVVVQTYNPEHPAIRFAVAQDCDQFYRYEIAAREACLYPPFGAFIRLLISGKTQRMVKAAAAAAHVAVKKRFPVGTDPQPLLFRASPAPIERIRGQWRYEIVLKFKETDMGKAVPRLRTAVHETEAGGALLDLEIRPQNMI